MNIEYYWVGNEYPVFLNYNDMETRFPIFIKFTCDVNSVERLLEYVDNKVGDNYNYILIKINSRFELRLFNNRDTLSSTNDTVSIQLEQIYKFAEEDEILFDDICNLFALDVVLAMIAMDVDIEIYPMSLDTLHKFIDIPLNMSNFALNVFNTVDGKELSQIISATANKSLFYNEDGNYLFKIVNK